MTTYVVATAEPPTIVCPTWCVIPVEEHISELEDWDGMVLHWSSERVLVAASTGRQLIGARFSLAATPAGTPDPDDPLAVHLYEVSTTLSPDEMVALAERLTALHEELQARRSLGPGMSAAVVTAPSLFEVERFSASGPGPWDEVVWDATGAVDLPEVSGGKDSGRILIRLNVDESFMAVYAELSQTGDLVAIDAAIEAFGQLRAGLGALYDGRGKPGRCIASDPEGEYGRCTQQAVAGHRHRYTCEGPRSNELPPRPRGGSSSLEARHRAPGVTPHEQPARTPR